MNYGTELLDLISRIMCICSKDVKKVVLDLFHACVSVMCCVWYVFFNSKVEVS